MGLWPKGTFKSSIYCHHYPPDSVPQGKSKEFLLPVLLYNIDLSTQSCLHPQTPRNHSRVRSCKRLASSTAKRDMVWCHPAFSLIAREASLRRRSYSGRWWRWLDRYRVGGTWRSQGKGFTNIFLYRPWWNEWLLQGHRLDLSGYSTFLTTFWMVMYITNPAVRTPGYDMLE